MKLRYLCLLVISLQYAAMEQYFAQGLPVDDVSKSLPCLDKNFNVRVVMTVDSATRQPLKTPTEVDEMLAAASEYFAPICVSLSSCSFEALENYSYNRLYSDTRIEEMGVVYHYPRRITLFIVNEVNGHDCGFSYYDGLNSRDRARIFVELRCGDNPAQQIAHHLGSLMGLLPTNYSLAEELADGSNCATAGDQICDTPADPYGAKRDSSGIWIPVPDPTKEKYTNGCDFIWQVKDNQGHFFNPKTTNMMSPYNCKCAFTREQFLRMVDNYHNSSHIKY